VKDSSQALRSTINTKLNIADTLTLSNRIDVNKGLGDQLVKDSSQALRSTINTKLNIADTMTLSNRINTNQTISDQLVKDSSAALRSSINTKLTITSAASTYAPLSSPGLTGVPTAPTAAGGTNTSQIATTAFVSSALSAITQPANTLTGTTLASNVVNSSLTSVGTLSGLNVTGTVSAGTLSGTFPAKSVTIGNLNASGTASSLTYLRGDGQWATPGTVSSVSVVTANGISGSVSNATTTPAITLSLGNITPTSVTASGTISGTSLGGTILTPNQPNIVSLGTLTSLAVSGDASITGTVSTTGGLNASAASSGNGIGYTSSGGSASQWSNKTNNLTINAYSGQITMDNQRLRSGSSVSFTVYNSVVGSHDVPLVVIAGGASTRSYRIAVESVSNGSFLLTLYNDSNSDLYESVVLNFVILKGN
jgi:hypothetical protein